MSFKLFLIFFSFILSINSDPTYHLRHEYKYTFKSPSILPKDYKEIPFFEHGGHAIANPNAVRLTASLPNQQGWIWSKNATMNFDGIQIDMIFSISGRGRYGADGMAIWFVKEKSYGGPAMGAADKWTGLGIFIDTYDNEGKGDSPYIHVIVNDGTQTYKPENDGRPLSIGHCIREIRNRPHPLFLRMIMVNNQLILTLTNGLARQFDKEVHLEPCISASVQLPVGQYYVGITSATGGLADDHDVLKFEVHSFTDQKQMTSEEEEKVKEERKHYEEEFKKDIDEIKKPETENEKEKMKSETIDNSMNQNLMVIWQELARQNENNKKILKHLLSSKSSDLKDSNVIEQIDGLRKEILGIKQSVMSLDGYNSNQKDGILKEIQTNIELLRNELSNNINKINAISITLEKLNQDNKSSSSNGISTTTLFFISMLQVVILISFFMYQKHRENASKKFY